MGEKYGNEYSEEKLFDKLKKVFGKAGVRVVYGVLLLFYALKDPAVPAGAKATIIGALGYFISPLDLIADPVPVIGYGDDFTAVITALGMISIYLTDETKEKAKQRTQEWFPQVTSEDFDCVDSKIK